MSSTKLSLSLSFSSREEWQPLIMDKSQNGEKGYSRKNSVGKKVTFYITVHSRLSLKSTRIRIQHAGTFFVCCPCTERERDVVGLINMAYQMRCSLSKYCHNQHSLGKKLIRYGLSKQRRCYLCPKKGNACTKADFFFNSNLMQCPSEVVKWQEIG